MAQPKPAKKKRRPRSDPVRREAAARREEARRQAAEERRRAEEAAERRQKIRKTVRRAIVPTVLGVGVIVAAIFLFRPQREIPGAETIDARTIVTELGYELPEEIDTNTLPDPACGVLDQPVSSAELLFSDLYNGAVVLWHATGDEATADALAELAADFPSHIVVSPSPEVDDGILATAWDRRKEYQEVDDELTEFVEAYRLNRAPKDAGCDLPE
ncbi:MAG TPA: DUF3105 domain-containing protein [Acidimicrobiia bacterium]|nr:DUF3105 domain-containing protein [Acidimicrobiia bacterium]